MPPSPAAKRQQYKFRYKGQPWGHSKMDAKLAVGVNFKSDIRNVLIEHPETMQYYVVLIMYHDGCVVIRNDAKLSTAQREERLDTLRKSVASEFQLTPVATTSPPLYSDPR